MDYYTVFCELERALKGELDFLQEAQSALKVFASVSQPHRLTLTLPPTLTLTLILILTLSLPLPLTPCAPSGDAPTYAWPSVD